MNCRILIVDDSLTVRMDLAEAFAEAGFDADACASLGEARDALQNNRYDLAVLDVLLPDGNGIDLLRQIRNSPSLAHLRVVLLSTESEASDRLRGLHTGADDYVGKPYDRGYLIAAARRLLHAEGEGEVTQTVLVIDDSRTYREELARALEATGYSVVTAASGEEGLSAALAHHPHAVVLDHYLPGMDGFSVLRRLRQDVQTRGVIAILLTGSATPEDELRALEAGADGFGRKDEDLGVVVARINAALRSASRPALDRSDFARSNKIVFVLGGPKSAPHPYVEAFSGEGYDVSVARSAADAAALGSAQNADAFVLLDFNLDALAQFVTEIRGAGKTHEPRVIVVGDAQLFTVLQALNAGADDYVLHSSGLDVLRARIRAQVRRKEHEDENRAIREQLLRRELEVRAQREIAEARAQIAEELRAARDLAVAKAREAERAWLEVRLVADAAPVWIWRTDAEGAIDYINRAFSDFTGMPTEAALGNGYLDALHPDDRQPTLRIFEQARSDSRDFAIQYRFRRSDGEYRWFLGRGEPYRDDDGAVLAWYGSAMDVHEQKIAEDERERYLAQMEAVFSSLASGLVLSDMQGRILYMNPAFARLHGFSPEQQNQSELDRFAEVYELRYPDGTPMPIEEWPIARATRGESRSGFEAVLRNKVNGQQWIGLFDMFPVFRRSGEQIMAGLTVRDVTMERRTEQALRRSEKLAAAGRLAASIAHEINNPLAAVMNLLYLVNQQAPPGTPMQEQLDMAQRELTRVSHIARQALSFYRDSGTAVPTDVCAIVRDLIAIYSPRIEQAAVRIDAEFGCEHPVVAFPGEVRQVVSNLLLNALEASAPGTRLRVRVREGFDPRSPALGGVRITISDQGRGIPPEHRHSVWQPFFTTKGDKGTGLGLWVTQHVVEQHGGKIRFRSSTRPGRTGTCFTVFLPASSRARSASEASDLFRVIGRELLKT